MDLALTEEQAGAPLSPAAALDEVRVLRAAALTGLAVEAIAIGARYAATRQQAASLRRGGAGRGPATP
jgi:hypothetical protein